MPVTLAFDVYGTLIDTHGVVSRLQEMVGEQAFELSRRWREKQLEYSFRRGLMQNYETFAVCTDHALDYTCTAMKIDLRQEQKEELLQLYRYLPAYGEVSEALSALQGAGFRLFAFSNGTAAAVENLLDAAGIRRLFAGVVSVDHLKTFKPSPAVYSYFLRKSKATGGSAWLVSGNPFDVIGAISAGMKAAWVKRSEDDLYDPWGIEPTLTVASIKELEKRISIYENAN